MNPDQKIEISHDILAREVYARIDADEKMRLKISQFLLDRYDYYIESGTLLGKKDLDYIDPYLSKVILSKEQSDFIQESRNEAEARARRVRRRNLIIGVILALAAIISTFFAIQANNKTKEVSVANVKAEKALEKAQENEKLANAEKEKVLERENQLKNEQQKLNNALNDLNKALREAKKQKDFAQVKQLEAEKANLQAKEQFRISEYRRFNALAQNELSKNNHRECLLLAIEGLALCKYAQEFGEFVSLGVSLSNSVKKYGGLYMPFSNFKAGFGNLNMEDEISLPSFSPQEDKVLMVLRDGTASLMDLKGQTIASFSENRVPIIHAVFSPDGNSILTAFDDGMIKFWDQDGNFKKKVTKHDKSINFIKFLPDGHKVLTASIDGKINLFDGNGNFFTELIGHKSKIIKATFSTTKELILTATADSTAILWDFSGKLIHTFKLNWQAYQGYYYKHEFQKQYDLLRFSSDGNTILQSSFNLFNKWDLKGNLLSSHTINININEEDDGWIESFIFHYPEKEHEQFFMTISSYDYVKKWDMAGQLVSFFNKTSGGDQLPPFSYSPITFSEGKILLPAKDRSAKLYTPNGDLITNFPHLGHVELAVFSKSTNLVLTKGNSFKIWSLVNQNSGSAEFLFTEDPARDSGPHTFEHFYQLAGKTLPFSEAEKQYYGINH